MRVPEITAVPDSPDIMEGVINLRGKIVPVMDLRKRFGEKETRTRQEEPRHGGGVRRKAGGLDRGCRVGSDEDSAMEIELPPAVFAEGESGYVTGVGKLKGRLIILVDFAKYLQPGDCEGQRMAEAMPFRLEHDSSDGKYKGRNKHGDRFNPDHGARAEASADAGLPGMRDVFSTSAAPISLRTVCSDA